MEQEVLKQPHTPQISFNGPKEREPRKPTLMTSKGGISLGGQEGQEGEEGGEGESPENEIPSSSRRHQEDTLNLSQERGYIYLQVDSLVVEITVEIESERILHKIASI